MTIKTLMVFLLLASACAPPSEEVVVFAAASLTEVLTDASESFESSHPEIELALSFGGSSLLAAQLESGAPADVFASADEEQMAAVVEAGIAEHPRALVTNRLALAVGGEAGREIDGARDLARPGVRVVLGAPEVPVGRYARAYLASLGIAAAVEDNVVSNETDVKEVLSKVLSGEADAGIVYRTDVTGEVSRAIDALPLPGAPEAVYEIAVLEEGSREAATFVDFLLSPRGRAILEEHGFAAP